MNIGKQINIWTTYSQWTGWWHFLEKCHFWFFLSRASVNNPWPSTFALSPTHLAECPLFFKTHDACSVVLSVRFSDVERPRYRNLYRVPAISPIAFECDATTGTENRLPPTPAVHNTLSSASAASAITSTARDEMGDSLDDVSLREKWRTQKLLRRVRFGP